MLPVFNDEGPGMPLNSQCKGQSPYNCLANSQFLFLCFVWGGWRKGSLPLIPGHSKDPLQKHLTSVFQDHSGPKN